MTIDRDVTYDLQNVKTARIQLLRRCQFSQSIVFRKDSRDAIAKKTVMNTINQICVSKSNDKRVQFNL
jgi:hypothetical protein